MTTFAFVCLTLALFALCGFFVYRYAKREIDLQIKASQKRYFQARRRQDALLKEFQAQMSHFESILKQIPQTKNLSLMPGMNVKDNMEDRWARENPKVVAVNDVQKVVG